MTDQITFNDEPDLPPAILDKPGFEPKIGGLVWYDTTLQENGSPTPFRMEVQVRDDNLAQELAAHWRIVRGDGPVPNFHSRELSGGTLLVRDLVFDVPVNELGTGQCHRLELAVSGSFFPNNSAPSFFDDTRIEGDIAYAAWTIWEGDGDVAGADAEMLLNTCDVARQFLPTSTVEP